jgi:hypothetical protein
MKSIGINPFNTTGGSFSTGCRLIDAQDYVFTQAGISYLFLNINLPGVNMFWVGRVAIFSATNASFYPDSASNVALYQ